MKNITRKSIRHYGYGALNIFVKVSIIIGIMFVFKYASNPEFEDARRHLHNVSYHSFKDHQREAYEITQHIHIEYFLLAITKDGRDIPTGKIQTISMADQYVMGPYSNDTRFIYELLKIIVNNEASLFYAQFKQIPTEDEMNTLLDEVPYYSYLFLLQDALYDMGWISHKTSQSKYIATRNKENINKLWTTFESKQKRMTDIILQNPSKMKVSTLHLM